MNQGIVIKSTGSRYSVKDKYGEIFECITGGKLRMKDSRITNPVAVGDIVLFDTENAMGVIKEIKPRKNYIIRKSSNLSKQAHVIASNIDLALLIITLKHPVTLTTFIDRFLVSAEAYRIPTILLFNKIDLYNNEELLTLDAIISDYEKAGYECHKISVVKNQNIDLVKDLIKDKVCMLSGHSGVGKSSLVRNIDPSIELKVSKISDSHHKGKHTTSYYEMYELASGGFIIDTPGIKGFGIVDINKNELYHFFPEFFKLSKDCQYNNCMHIHEPNCAVIKALETGEAALSRYHSYLSIMDGDEGKHRNDQ